MTDSRSNAAAERGAAAKFKIVDEILQQENKWLEKATLESVADVIVNSDYYTALTEKEKAVKFMLFGFGILKIFDCCDDDIRSLQEISGMPENVVKAVVISHKADDFYDSNEEE